MPTIVNKNKELNVVIVNRSFRIDGVDFPPNTQLRWSHKEKSCSCKNKPWNYNVTAYADGVPLPDNRTSFKVTDDFVVEGLIETHERIRPLALDKVDAQRYRNNKLGVAPKDTIPTHRDKDGFYMANGNMDYRSGKTDLKHD
ncbi:MAG: hypothetical protein AB8G11_02420 [Saprospiraceae bacterium]